MLKLLAFGLQARLSQPHRARHREALVGLIEERRVAAQGLPIQRPHDLTAGLERTAGLVALRTIIEQALDTLAGELLAETLQHHLTHEDQERPVRTRGNLEALGPNPQTLRHGFGEVQFGDDVGLDREPIALRVGKPTPAHPLEVKRKRTGGESRRPTGQALGGNQRPVGARKRERDLPVLEGLPFEFVQVPRAGFGRRLHGGGPHFPGLLGLGVLRVTRHDGVGHFLESDFLWLSAKPRRQEQSQPGGAHA